MKKYLILSISALLALAACSKQEPVDGVQHEISFLTANYLSTKAGGDTQAASPVKFSNADFGVYAWFNGKDVFMENEKVAQVGTLWKTVDNTFYWPKTGSLDFIAYSPYNEGTPAVATDKISWTKYTVSDKDLMYADKACGQQENINPGTYNAVSAANGVPTLFHHALARLSFKAKASFLSYTNPEEKDAQGNVVVAASTTTWEVTLLSAKISGISNTGDLALSLTEDGAWEPEGGAKPRVWKNASGSVSPIELVSDTNGIVLSDKEEAPLYVGEDGKARSFFVLPQNLLAATQTLAVKFHIKTTLANRQVIEEDYEQTLDLKDISSLAAWEMNQNIVYTISIKPTSSVDPANAGDPSDVTITFDPAQVDWETVDAEALIQI